MHIRELTADLGWLVLIVLLLPLAIPLGGLAFVFLLGQRLYAWTHGRMGPGYAGGTVARRRETVTKHDDSARWHDKLALTASAGRRHWRDVGALLNSVAAPMGARRG
jgi:hypothetical protein